MSFSCRVFFYEFLKEFRDRSKNKKKIIKLWQGYDKTWTKLMLGDGKSRKKKDFGLLGDIGKKYGYTLQAEWLKLDLVWWWKADEDDEDWITDVVIEHENNPRRIKFTIIKLCEVNSNMRVLISYLEDEDNTETLDEVGEIIRRKLLRQGDKFLLILGDRDDKGGDIIWDAYEFDSLGNVFKLPSP